VTDPQHAYTRRLLAADPGSWPARPAANGSTAPILLNAQRLSKRYGNRLLFEKLDLALHPGERVAITGPSGSGKTTLGNILMGLVAADSGTLLRSARLGPLDFQKLYQDPGAAFAPGVTLRRSLLDLLRLHRIPWPQVSSMMDQLRLAGELLDRRPQQVSGGELQRFALLRVLLLKPALIFADEPTSRLDPITQSETFDLLIATLGKHDSALLLVTHNEDLARNVADRQLRISSVSSDIGNQAAKS
jgi:peptide/nickel transport system ATP-binding protein